MFEKGILSDNGSIINFLKYSFFEFSSMFEKSMFLNFLSIKIY